MEKRGTCRRLWKTLCRDFTTKWSAYKLANTIILIAVVYLVLTILHYRYHGVMEESEPFISKGRKPLDYRELDGFLDLKPKQTWAKVLHSPTSICDKYNTSPSVLILVHSHPANKIQRDAIRKTWGNLKFIEEEVSVKLLFVLGIHTKTYGVLEEKHLNDDILIGDFLDTYRNLTKKHQFGLKWVVENCPELSLIFKADDDAFVDVRGLLSLIKRNLGTLTPTNTIACDVIPEGSKPSRSGKWKVTKEEYPYESYPRYCSGLAYVISMDAAKKLTEMVDSVEWLWIDDVWLTGMVAEPLNLFYFKLNTRYCYENVKLGSNGELDARFLTPACSVIHLDRNSHYYNKTLQKLWRHYKQK